MHSQLSFPCSPTLDRIPFDLVFCLALVYKLYSVYDFHIPEKELTVASFLLTGDFRMDIFPYLCAAAVLLLLLSVLFVFMFIRVRRRSRSVKPRNFFVTASQDDHRRQGKSSRCSLLTTLFTKSNVDPFSTRSQRD